MTRTLIRIEVPDPSSAESDAYNRRPGAGDVWGVQSAFPADPVVGDTLYYRPRSDDDPRDLILHVLERVIPAGVLHGAFLLHCKIDGACTVDGEDATRELLEHYGFTRQGA